MADNSRLNTAKTRKKDEFYTQLADIEREMAHYRAHFHGKTVLCNCDDPVYSNFWKYFHTNFGSLGLKKLISTHYDPTAPTYKMEYTGGDDDNVETGVRTDLMQNGDFRSPECIEILKEADVVVTNPPFSLFREYISQLIEYGKKFIIIGNMNAITYRAVFPHVMKNEIWLGYGFPGKAGWFISDYTDYAAATKHKAGMIRVAGVVWYTNLDIPRRSEPLPLSRKYSEEPWLYPKFDGFDAINVDKTADIPMDYDGIMGVPISFIDKYCPAQFEIVGKINAGPPEPWDLCKCAVNGKEIFKRIAIRRR